MLDKNGNVVYSFETDTDLVDGNNYTAHTSPTTTGGKAGLYLWASAFTTKFTYRYSVADTLTTHTPDDYKIRTFDETYTPYVAPPVTSDTSTSSTTESDASTASTASTPETPPTGAAFPMAVLGIGVVAAAAALVTYRKKHS